MRALCLNLFLILSVSWFDRLPYWHCTTRSRFHLIISDSMVILFGDSSYKLTLNIFDTTHFDNARNNAALTFTKQERNQVKVIFKDSVYCMNSDIDFYDFNNDKIKDVIVFHSTGARANPTYYLYLIDVEHHRLARVKGFEELPNPDLDTTNNIITSVALAGTNYYSFYRINPQNKLINLGHSFEENPRDSTQYENAIQQILKQKK